MLRAFVRVVAVVIAIVALVAIAVGFVANRKLVVPQSPLEFEVAPGSSVRGAARRARAAGVPINEWEAAVLARLSRRPNAMKPGVYAVQSGTTPLELVRKLLRGDIEQIEVTLIEGWTFDQLRHALAASASLKHDLAALPERKVLTIIGAAEAHPEGLFFPDTYRIAKRAPESALLKLAYATMRKRLEAAWEARDPQVPLKTPYDALILASVVEKETGRAEDRPLVASVFLNRLRQGMRLQSDPTVIYGLGARFDGNLRRRDLLEDSPYNTYTRAGLPPTPIAMPGLASLQSVLRAPASDALYFVSRGDGSSHFSRTLDEHNRAVAKYQRGG